MMRNLWMHPADGDEWKEFDIQHPEFALEPHNVRLGIAIDGFNPFGNMDNSYSIWPVILIPYNLPPWLIMKEPFLMLSLLIPRDKQPGIDIDVYMQPLKDELKELWNNGALTYDASSGESFQMRVTMWWTVHDWPAFGDISGWRTKGHYACYPCNDEPFYESLRSKTAYLNHRAYFPNNHPERRKKAAYDGKSEERKRSLELPVHKIEEQLKNVPKISFGKDPSNRKRPRYEPNWTKVSILYDMPCCKNRKLLHNIDVMHVEKNFGEALWETMLGIEGKNKDTDKARNDLEDRGIRKELWLTQLKYPDGYATNISRFLGKLKRFLSNRARPEGSIVEAYIVKKCITFCSMYLDGVETAHNRPERNEDLGVRRQGLTVFTETARPILPITRDGQMSQELRDIAHWFLLYNSPELEKYLEYVLLLIILYIIHMNRLRVEESPEATDELWSLANGPNLLVKEYSGCIINGVKFHTREVDDCRTSQNSGVLVVGDHEGEMHDFYGHLSKVWEFGYRCSNKVVLFQCEWYNTGNTGRTRTIRTDAHCTSIDVTSRWYQSDPFVLRSQAKQVFYLNDTKWGKLWQVVQQVQHRGVFDVSEVNNEEPRYPMKCDDAFQQENITSVVPIDVEVEVHCHRDGAEDEVMLGVGPLDETIEESGDDEDDEDDEIPDVEMDPDVDYDICNNKMANGKKNFIKPCSLATMKKTKYEMARDERMKENNARLKAAGIDRILANLRGSSLPNCMNEKRRGTKNGVDDPDYMPPSIEDTNDDESLDSLEHEPSPPLNVEIQSEAAAVSNAVAPNRRGRGISCGLELQRLVKNKGKLLVPIPPEYRAPVGTYASKLASKIGVEVYAQVEDLSVKSWKAVDEGIKAPLLQSLKDQFDFEGDPIDVNKAITSRCGRRLSDYTHRLYEKFKKLKATKGEAYARSHPPPQIAMEQWTRLIEKKWTNKDWLLRSEKNIENRRSNKTKHRCGTKSLAVRVHEHALKNEGQLPKLPEFHKSTLYNDNTGKWIAPKCQTNYEEMVLVDATLNQEGATPLTGEQMSVTVLKQRPGYVKGLGLKPSSSIRTTSKTALKALGLRPSSSAMTHEYVSCLEMKI
ncbi:hypothetical protein RHSIM_Rhsim06G0076200 [Rhododendron simsii]|uniref:DUF4218 domain-containing protein n=1 Tax=Rhododendron simsii TaxID=118357 RepID=A0A834GW74_RHOSS|nr:hypothetical protein RHSIM_Rhsim06G0076200 [Rhododendron simsii]